MPFELTRQYLDSLLLQRSLLLLGKLLRDLDGFLPNHCIFTLGDADSVRSFNRERLGIRDRGAS